MATEDNTHTNRGAQVACWISLLAAPIGIVLLMLGVLAQTLNVQDGLTLGVVAALVAGGLSQIVTLNLAGLQCEMCNEHLFPMIWPKRSQWRAAPLCGSPTLGVKYQCATTGRLQCMWCGHEDGKRRETIRMAP